MTKRRTGLAAALLAAALILTACGAAAPAGPEPGGADPAKYNDSLITELISAEGDLTDEFGSTEHYSFHVPQIAADTEAAQAINREIGETHGAFAREGLELIETEGFLGGCSAIGWQSHWEGALLSLVIETDFGIGVNDYAVYHYDFAAGERVTREELLARMGVREEEFLREARRASVQAFDRSCSEPADSPESVAAYYRFLLPLRSATEGRISLENADFYPDGDVCRLLATIETPAGGGYYRELCTLQFGERLSASRTAEQEGIRAVLADNSLSVTVEDTPENRERFLPELPGEFPGETLSFGRTLPVGGLYSEYTDLLIGNMVNGMTPFVFLLTENGTVEFVNLSEGIRMGILAAMPVPFLSGVRSLEAGTVVLPDADTGTEEEYDTVFAVLPDGSRVSLMNEVFQAQEVLPWDPDRGLTLESGRITHPVASGGSYDSIYRLEFSRFGQCRLLEELPDVGTALSRNGRQSCLGMSGEGLLFSCCFHPVEDAGEPASLASALALRVEQESGDYLLKVLTGAELFDRPGEAVPFGAALSAG